jgi:thioredoxin-like negative regulator of GroEL
MQQQAAEALERQLKLEELLAEARGCETAGDFEECLRVCDHALQISPENPEILSLWQRASETLAKQRRVAELLSRSRQKLSERNLHWQRKRVGKPLAWTQPTTRLKSCCKRPKQVSNGSGGLRNCSPWRNPTNTSAISRIASMPPMKH